MKLTKKEIEIGKLLILENPDIAEILKIKRSTVATHLNHMFYKCTAFNKTQLLFILLVNKIITIKDIEESYKKYIGDLF